MNTSSALKTKLTILLSLLSVVYGAEGVEINSGSRRSSVGWSTREAVATNTTDIR